jgi:HK97 family phage major capsid protein
MKKRLENLLAQKNEQRKNLNNALIESDSKEERAAIGETLTALAAEITEIEAMVAEIDEPAEDTTTEENKDANKGDERNMNVLATMEQRSVKVDDAHATLEYRNAFKNFIANGGREELRAAAGNTTTADNVGTAIPTNLLNQIIEKIESVGTIYKLVTHTAFPVGQTIPREATKPVATWVGVNGTPKSGEGLGSTVVKGATLDTAIVFANFKLRCEVAMTEEVAQMALPAFEALFVKNVSLAMLRAIEYAIVEGTGTGMPTGILTATVPTGQALTIAADKELGYDDLCAAEGAIPARYEAGAKWCMTKKTFMSFVGMMDSVGQPVARVNYGIDGKPERTLLGREVVLYEAQTNSKLGNYAPTVSANTLFAFIFDFGDYTLNNNYDLGIQHKKDWDNEDHRTKAVAAYDGKVVDNGSLVTLTKTKSA